MDVHVDGHLCVQTLRKTKSGYLPLAQVGT